VISELTNWPFGRQGSYADQIDQCIYDTTRRLDADGDQWLFYCVGGEEGRGIIEVVSECDGSCHDSGGGNNDYCVSAMTEEM